MTADPPFDPLRELPAAVARLLAAREAGATLRQAAATAGVHASTVCRWALRSPYLAESLRAAERAARHRRFAALPPYKPRRPDDVPWHPLCPRCGAATEVWRSTSGRLFWWGCRACTWASWRPRHPRDCPACGGPRYWAHSRRSVGCPCCRTREKAG
jgi:hypothetical protein